MIYSTDEAARLLTLQQKAYRLFIWITDSLSRGEISFTENHSNLPASDAMKSWLRKNQAAFPDELEIYAIEPGDMDAFINLALSFPVVSFEPKEGGELIGGCDCGFCAVYSRPHFKPRSLSKKDKERAEQFIDVALTTLGEDLGLKLGDDQIGSFRKKHPELERDARVIAYLNDLSRRTRYEAHGTAGLVLWRRLKTGKNFKIEADAYSKAVQAVSSAMKEFAGGK